MARLLQLSVVNFGKISAAVLDFDGKGNLIKIKGENGVGKSTLLNSLAFALLGAGAVPNDIIKRGEKKAVVDCTFDKFKVKSIARKSESGNTTCQVEVTFDGMVQKNPPPREFLKKLASKFPDPNELANMNETAFRAAVMANLGIDFTEIDKQISILEAQRKAAGQKVKAFGEPVPVPKVEPVDITELAAEQRTILEFNAEQDARQAKIKRFKTAIEGFERESSGIDDQIAELQEKINALIAKKTGVVERIRNGETALSEAPQPEEKKPTTDIEARLATASDTNAKAAAHTAYLAKIEARKQLENEYAGHDKSIKDLRTKKTEELSKASLLPGLEFAEDGSVKMESFTWGSISTSKKLEACTRLCMAMVPADGVRLLWIARGESLLTPVQSRLAQIAAEKDFMVVMEVASEDPPTDEPGVFYIVDGEVAGV